MSQTPTPPHDPWTDKARPAAAEPASAPQASGKPEQWMHAWAKEVLLEQRRARRSRFWGGLIKSLITLVIVLVIFGSSRELVSLADRPKTGEAHLAVVEVQGVIAQDARASAERVLAGAQRAFAAEGAQAVVLRINSPGGSPVQAGQIFDGLLALKAAHPDLPVYAVIEDLAASGGYYVAVAADQLLADRASLVGSIGVISGGFGFVEAIDRLGVERRAYTSGDNKAFLDPFAPRDPEQEAFWQAILDNTHQQFIERVRSSRGDRLADNPQLFSGLVWNGELALEQGLIDELGSLYSLKAQLGVDHWVNYTPEPSPWERLERRLATSLQTLLWSSQGQRLF